MRTPLWQVTWCTLALLWPHRLGAQTDVVPLVTDRPDQTESTAIVPRGRGQLEVGSAFANQSSSTETAGSLTLLSALLRVGVLERLEARLGFLGWTRQTGSGLDQAESGFGSFELGVKYQIREGRDLDPSVALLGGVVIPTGGSGVRAERVDPSFRIAAAHELGERVGLGYNLGVRGVSIRHGAGGVTTEAEGIYTASVGVGLTDWLAVFGEAFGALALSSQAVDAHLVDAGLTLLLRHNLQLDVSGGKGYAGAADNWFVSAGVSIRLPR